MLGRRRFLSHALGTATLLATPRILLATVPTERRFVFVIQRGAADGLDIVRPVGDPAYAGLRGALAKDAAEGIKLDGMFTLHPALAQIGQMYGRREALFVHAVASPYRDRSHFDGQNVLETGSTAPYTLGDGWLNRLVAIMPRSTDAAIAIAPTVPLALRGPVPVASYVPSGLPPIGDDLLTRTTALYAADPQFHPLWSSALDASGLATGLGAGQDPASLGRLTASFLTRPAGPRIAMIETTGWDTHVSQVAKLAAPLKSLDTMIATLRDALGPVWAQTTVLVATEFGRTAAANGTGGTDHGTASAAILVGGAVRGGRVIADWPGLAPAALYQQRDLAPTAGLDALIAGAAAEALAIDPQRVAHGLFTNTRPMTGLVTT